MIHEIAYATLHALTEIPLEPFFGEHGSGEAGWEFEARLFGLCPSEERFLSGKCSWYVLSMGRDVDIQAAPVGRV